MKKFLCSLETSYKNENEATVEDCIPCYKENNKSHQNYKHMMKGGFEYVSPVLGAFPIEQLKVLFVHYDDWKYLGEAVLHKNIEILNNYGSGITSLDERIRLLHDADEYDVWNLKDCNQYSHYDL